MTIHELITYGLKILIGLLMILLLFRLMGNKELAQVTPTDLVFVVILGDLISGIIHDPQSTYIDMITVCLLWVVAIYFVEWISKRNPQLYRWINGTPQILIRDGKVDRDIMKRHRMNTIEVEAMLRAQNIFDLQDVELAIIEVSGDLSVKKKEGR